MLPLPAWPARDASGNLFDVPDTFDGTISNSFGFYSPETLKEMSWNEGTHTGLDFHPGWGGLHGSSGYLTSFSDELFGRLPINVLSAQALNGSVSATSVPEPSSCLFMAFAGVAMGAISFLRKRHSHLSHL